MAKYLDMLRQLSLTIPFIKALKEMPSFVKYLKDLVTKKRIPKDEEIACISVLDELDDMEGAQGPSVVEGDLDKILATILGTYNPTNDAEGYEEVVNLLEGIG
ncbi:hypothetical protein HAX54_010120 [Datura stramonium]|uniref:Uncharacterized protein n=1 Tax=Datura stramonium TaxID=4076 RepID=A0ABS8WVP8_DATST|nr:hypothetical protein [Datura stramonium]